MHLRFHLPIRKRLERQASYGPIVDEPSFESLKLFTTSTGLAPQVTYGNFCTVNCALDHPKLPELFTRLKNLNWLPYPGYAPERLRSTHYNLRVIKEFDKAEIENAHLLRLRQWGEWNLTGFAGRNGERWVGSVDFVGKSSGEGWGQQIGSVHQHFNYFVDPDVRIEFESHLNGLQFFKLNWDDATKAKHDYWEIDTPNVMPVCLTKVVSKDGLFDYEDGPDDPVELAWYRSDIHEIGEFDLAWTREEIGDLSPSMGRHYLIVSQKFRAVCENLGLATDYVPVRLAEKGWTPKNPFSYFPFLQNSTY